MKKYYDNPKYDAAFDRCIDVMMKLIQKYGPPLLEEQASEQKGDQDNTDHAA